MENKEKVRNIMKNQGKVMENDEKVRKIMKNQRKILEKEENVRKNEGKPMKTNEKRRKSNGKQGKSEETVPTTKKKKESQNKKKQIPKKFRTHVFIGRSPKFHGTSSASRLWQKIVCQELGQVAEKVDGRNVTSASLQQQLPYLTNPNYHGMGDRDTR